MSQMQNDQVYFIMLSAQNISDILSSGTSRFSFWETTNKYYSADCILHKV